MAVAGIAVLVLSCGDGTVEPTPPPAPVATTVTVNPGSAALSALGETVRLTAEVRDQKGQLMAGAAVAWTSSNASVAWVDASGLVTAAANGSATITATAGSASGTGEVTVAQAVSTVAVSPAADTLMAFGDTVRLTAEATDANGQAVAGAEFDWESSDDAVATVDGSGLLTAVANGTATVTATAGSASGSATATVSQQVSAVAVSPPADTLVAGDTLRLRAEATDANGYVVANAEFAWASSDTLVARVDDLGLVTGVKAGEAAITAASGVATGRTELVVTPARWTLSGTISHGWADPRTNGFGDGANSGMHAPSNRQRYLDDGDAQRHQRHLGGVRGPGTATPAITTPDGEVVGAVVEIVDGPDAGRQAITDDSGHYVLEALEQEEFVIEATAEGFASVSGVVNLTSDRVLDFTISQLPVPQPPSPFPDTDPTWLKTVASDYAYAHQVANVRVFSDISPTFSREHAGHLKRVWDFFSGLYVKNRGDYLDAYYTSDSEVFQKVVPHCPTTFIPGARNLTACYLDYPRWFITPYQIPDFGTQVHEIGHDFLYATWPQAEAHPWFKEGTAMYFEGGVFDDNGSLRVPAPLPYCTILFRRYDQQGGLIPLASLLRLEKAAFLAENERTYSQSCMLFDYLERNDPGVLYAMIHRINSGQIVSNDQLITALLDLTGKSVSELEEAYQSHARQSASSDRDDDV